MKSLLAGNEGMIQPFLGQFDIRIAVRIAVVEMGRVIGQHRIDVL